MRGKQVVVIQVVVINVLKIIGFGNPEKQISKLLSITARNRV